MRLRTKLLLGLLAISLVPLAIMRLSSQATLRDVGRDLARTFSTTLLDNAESELARLVEDHARIIRSESLLIEAVLRARAAELESLTAAPDEPLSPTRCAEPPARMPEHLAEAYCADTGWGDCESMRPDFDAVTLFPSRRTVSEGTVQRIPLAQIIPQMKHSAAALGGAALWQAIQPAQGPAIVYPGLRALPPQIRLHELRAIAPETCDIGGPVWSQPVPDPLTGRLVLTAHMGWRDLRNATIAGVVSLSVPLHAVLHENQHVLNLSDEASAILVRVEGDPPRLRVVAREMRPDEEPERHALRHGLHRGRSRWAEAPGQDRLPVEDPDGYAALAANILRGRSSVTGMPYRGEESFWAYASLDPAKNLALLLVIPKDDLTRQGVMAEEYVQESILHQIRLTSLWLLGILVLVLVMAFLLARSISRPVGRLTRAVRRVARGDFSVRAQMSGKDEIAQLGEAFDRMVPALEDRVRLRQSVNLAQEIQQSLLPGEAPRLPGLDLAGTARYSDETGGDLYDFITFPGDAGVVGVALGDVSGHGVPAALLMASARAALRSRLVAPGWAAEAVGAVNRLVARDTASTGHFLTLFYLEIDTRARRAAWVRAGQDPALVLSPDGVFSELDGYGMALGLDPDAVFVQQEQDLLPGQIILIGTDGIWESLSPDGEMYGKQRLREVLAANAHRPAADIVETVLADLALFRHGLPQEDDITLTVAKLLG